MEMTAWSLEHGMCVRRWGSGRTVVWIHGLGESSVSFEPIAHHPAFAGYRHVMCDLPGYGRSPWPDEPERIEGLDALADRLAGWIRATCADPPLAIGHSMGGVLAQLVAERGAARAIVDIDGNLTRGDCTFSAQAIADPDPVSALAAVRDAVWARAAAAPALRGYMAPRWVASPHVLPPPAAAQVAMSARGDLAPRLVALRVPALFVAGVPDVICAASRARLTELGARWVGIEPAGHWVYLDQPDAFARAVVELIQAA
jgi:pimeloyl-ACP methyl ester carboxylesterase